MQPSHPHWEIPIFEIGSNDTPPTYAAHCIGPLTEVEEIGKALGSPYPHFHAVLTLERNFLHYVISGLVCNAAIPNKDYLFERTEQLYNAYVGKLEEPDLFERIKKIGESAREYYQNKKHAHSTEKPAPSEWEEIYRILRRSLYTGYLPGMKNTALNTLEKVFCRICESQFVRREYEKGARNLANAVIQEEIDAGRLKALPQYGKDERFNIVLAGIIAAGKNYFLDRMINEGQVKRADFAYVDLDELKDLRLIVDKADDLPSQPDSWNKRAHDECHMIRRKTFDELESMAKNGRAPNVLMMTSLLSERVLDWLTYDNPKTNLYLFYCDADQALQNSLKRNQNGGRRMSTQVILESVNNLARSTAYILYQTTSSKHNLFIQMEDTTMASTEGSKTILKADRNNGLHLYDLAAFIKSQEGIFINPRANHPSMAYHDFTQAELDERIRAILRPHKIIFYDREGHPYADKLANAYKDTINLCSGNRNYPELPHLMRLDPECLIRSATRISGIGS